MATSDLKIEGQGHKTIAFVALPIYTHILNLKVLTKIFFKLSRPKGNLCGGGCGGVTVLNPKYPRLSSGDTINEYTVIVRRKTTNVQMGHCVEMTRCQSVDLTLDFPKSRIDFEICVIC